MRTEGGGPRLDAPASAAARAELVVEVAGRSAIGHVRARNEDRLGWLARPAGTASITPADEASFGAVELASDDALAFAVADGLGAYGGGDVAAGLAVETCLGHVRSDGAPGGRAGGLLRAAFARANQAVFDAALAGMAGAARKMQSTLTALVLTPGEAWLGHVGDCRVYRRRGDALDILTTDHSQVMELLRLRLVSPDQAVEHPARYALTRSLGGDIAVRADVRSEPLVPGDTFLLCSDGLWSAVATADIRDSLRLAPAEACNRLVAIALDAGGEDNATAMAISVRSAGSKPVTSQGWRRFFS